MKKEAIIRQEFNLPREVSEVKGKDGKTYLQFNTSMATIYKQTYGELTEFFKGIKEGKLIGSRCKKCGNVLVPAATWRCPNCDFAEMEKIELPHHGVLAATAPITIFPSASFIGDAPFCRGYIDVATGAPIASFLPSRLRTTTGLPRPGIFVKGVELKLVFREQREGSIRDIFWVPMKEVPEHLRKKEPLLESELSFKTPPTPEVKQKPELKSVLNSALAAMQKMTEKIAKSPRAQQDIKGRKHTIGVKTAGGDFGINIHGDRMKIVGSLPEKSDFVMVTEDPKIFISWSEDGSLTDAAVEGILWLPHRDAFAVLPILDRLPRSVRRDMKKD